MMEIIDKLFLELSLVSKAKTKRELELEKELKELRHFHDSSVGLWCTDRPDLVSEKINDPGFFETFFWKLKD